MDRQVISELVERLAKALEMRDYDQFLTPFAQDAVFETPFGIEGSNVYRGIDQISQHFSRVRQNPLFSLLQLTNITASWQYDPEQEVITVEYEMNALVTSTQRSFTIPSSIALIWLKDNQIVRYKDVPNTVGLAKAAGLLNQLAARFNQGS